MSQRPFYTSEKHSIARQDGQEVPPLLFSVVGDMGHGTNTRGGPQVSSTLTDTLYEGQQMDRDLEAEPAKPSVLCLLGKSLVPRGMGTAA